MLLYTGCGRCWYAGGGTSVEYCCIQVVVDVGMLEEGPVSGWHDIVSRYEYTYSTFIGKSKILCQNRFVEEAVSRDFYLT